MQPWRGWSRAPEHTPCYDLEQQTSESASTIWRLCDWLFIVITLHMITKTAGNRWFSGFAFAVLQQRSIFRPRCCCTEYRTEQHRQQQHREGKYTCEWHFRHTALSQQTECVLQRACWLGSTCSRVPVPTFLLLTPGESRRSCRCILSRRISNSPLLCHCRDVLLLRSLM